MQKRLALLAAVGLMATLSAAGQESPATNLGSADRGAVLGGPKNKKEKAPTTRYLHGTVTDETNQPVAGALVTLHNAKTNDRLTFITKKDGRYHFDDVSFNVDFSVQARFKKEVSAERKISQYDNRPDVVRMLELQDPQGANASK